MTRPACSREGFTLVELLVVIAILGVATGLSSVALRPLDTPRDSGTAAELLAARSEAIRSGRSVTRMVSAGTRRHVVTVLADGRVLADSALHLDLATGRLDDAAR